MAQHAWRQQLSPGMVALGLTLTEDAQVRLLAFIELLVKWNAAYNLTAVRDPAEMISRHLLDSLGVQPFVHGSHVADVGTGAGLPGIPLAIALPDRHFVLLDSNGKKTRFVIQAAANLGLRNVEVVQARVEDYRPAQPFATVVTRAFAALRDFVELAGHLGAPGSRFLAMKGDYPADELRALPAGFQTLAVHPLRVPGLDAKRCVVEIQKSEV